jgi:hypothetical protein
MVIWRFNLNRANLKSKRLCDCLQAKCVSIYGFWNLLVQQMESSTSLQKFARFYFTMDNVKSCKKITFKCIKIFNVGGAISWSSKRQPIINFVNNWGWIHGKHVSYQGSHMDDKVHEGIKVHERKENDNDSMWQPRCNIIDKESHPTCSNKAHWCAHPSHLGSHWLVLWVMCQKLC